MTNIMEQMSNGLPIAIFRFGVDEHGEHGLGICRTTTTRDHGADADHDL